MKAVIAALALAALLLYGCVQPPATPPITNLTNMSNGTNTANGTPAANGTNITPAIPPGYEVKDYCAKDSDCVRQKKCCDCGPGEYVNAYNLGDPYCPGPRCLCPMQSTKGACVNNKCVAVADNGTSPSPSSGFCGWETNGTCSSDSGCMSGGCSGQVCQSKSEKGVITTCEYTECYNAAAYGVSCGCAGGKCQWK